MLLDDVSLAEKTCERDGLVDGLPVGPWLSESVDLELAVSVADDNCEPVELDVGVGETACDALPPGETAWFPVVA